MANSSGPSQVVASLVGEFCKRGHQGTIFYVKGRNADLTMPLHVRCRVIAFPATVLRRWAYAPALGRELRTAIAGFDLVHVHSMWLYPNIAVANAARRSGVPYIIRPAGSLEPWCYNNSVKKKLYLQAVERPILDRSAALHAMSDQEAKTLKQFRFKAPIFTLPKGQDLQIGPQRNSSNVVREYQPNDRKNILFLGRIHHVKGLDILGRAFAIVRQKIPDAKLMIAGPDQHAFADQVKAMYSDLGIFDACQFLGEVTEDRKWEVFRASDVFVLPSRSENFGVAVLEALSTGLPAIVSHNAPWSVLNEFEAGFWIENDARTIANKLIQVLTDHQLRESMVRNAVRLVEERFSWPVVVDALENVYRNILLGRTLDAPSVGAFSEVTN